MERGGTDPHMRILSATDGLSLVIGVSAIESHVP